MCSVKSKVPGDQQNQKFGGKTGLKVDKSEDKQIHRGRLRSLSIFSHFPTSTIVFTKETFTLCHETACMADPGIREAKRGDLAGTGRAASPAASGQQK